MSTRKPYHKRADMALEIKQTLLTSPSSFFALLCRRLQIENHQLLHNYYIHSHLKKETNTHMTINSIITFNVYLSVA